MRGWSAMPDGSKIIYPLEDMFVLDEIWMENVYEKDRKIERGDVVMDCGAHVGTFTVKAAMAGARIVVAIEPDPTNYALLRRNVRLNKLDNIVVVNAAVGGRQERQRTKRYWRKELTAQVRTIKSLVCELGLECVNFMKINVEGDEVEVIEGAEGMDVKHIVLEYHGESVRTQVEHLLRRKGYAMTVRQRKNDKGYICARSPE